jgi:hypothetical protein
MGVEPLSQDIELGAPPLGPNCINGNRSSPGFGTTICDCKTFMPSSGSREPDVFVGTDRENDS